MEINLKNDLRTTQNSGFVKILNIKLIGVFE